MHIGECTLAILVFRTNIACPELSVVAILDLIHEASAITGSVTAFADGLTDTLELRYAVFTKGSVRYR